MKSSLILLLCLIGTSLSAQSQYIVSVDLTDTDGDQIPVTIQIPQSDQEYLEYHMAKIVPGTYSISDFGRFVTNFKAVDINGNEVSAEQISTNKWKFKNQPQIREISYRVHDTRDPFEGYDESSENVVFEPGGTNINADEQLFMLNTFGLIGYIDGMKDQPYDVTFTHHPNLYGATALLRKATTETTDTFTAADFNFLADGPVMYCLPDTVSKTIGNAEIIVSVYSPNTVLTARDVMDHIDDLMEAQSQYLGGELPVDRYAYLIALFDDNTMTGAYGALEHSYSSLYNLPERAGDRLSQIVRDVSAHEFFHIVTPLNIHSEQIGDFDYIDPQMSAHLWLYEGVTEYSSMHVQVKYGLYSAETFLDEIASKLGDMDEFPKDVSFTEMSRRILEPEFEPMYRNVYAKGALIGMCLDLYILKYSNGEKDLQWLMRELAKKYGKETSFKDEELFDVIESLTYPEVKEFLVKHVEGAEPLPIDEVLGWAGIDYTPAEKTKTVSAGNIAFGLDENNNILVADISQMNSFGEALGLEKGDILANINGMELKLENYAEVFAKYKAETKAGDKVYFKVMRENKKGKLKTKKLKAKAIEVDTFTAHKVSFSEDPTEAQQQLLKAWTTTE